MIMSLSRIVANYILRLALSSLAVLMMVIMRTTIDIVHTTSHAIIVVVYSKKSDDRHHSGNFHRPYLDHGWLHRNDGVDDHYGCE